MDLWGKDILCYSCFNLKCLFYNLLANFLTYWILLWFIQSPYLLSILRYRNMWDKILLVISLWTRLVIILFYWFFAGFFLSNFNFSFIKLWLDLHFSILELFKRSFGLKFLLKNIVISILLSHILLDLLRMCLNFVGMPIMLPSA